MTFLNVNEMNIKTKLTLAIAVLNAMIILVLGLSIINLQILTETEPTSPLAGPALNRALIWVSCTGAICILIGLGILYRLPKVINEPLKEISNSILEIANHNYDVTLNLTGSRQFESMSKNFNRMVNRLKDYHNSTLSDLKTSKRYLETIINAINEPIIGLDNDSKITFINDEALNIINLTRDEIKANNDAKDIAIHNDLLRRLLRGLTEGNASDVKTGKRNALKIYADNKECYFQVAYMDISMKGNDGITMEKHGNVVMLKNVTEYQELDTAKTTFISTISHELKTPISAILMSLQLLEDRRVGALNNEQVEMAESIRENSERLLSITGELLNMTQVESGKLQLKPKITKPIELIDYALHATRVQAEKSDVQIEVDYPENKVKKLFVDSEKIAWVLTNLLNNAIRYSAEYGRVVISVKQPDDNHLSIAIQDFGKGIDPRYHESIFEPYFRVPGTKVQGSGLGLSISRDFVEAHGGTLKIESEIGKGSKFIMTLPV